MFCHEKDAHNVVAECFFTKICSKRCNSSETLHNDHEILLEVQNTNNSEFGL